MPADFVLTRDTDLPLETVCQRLPDISAAHKFGVLGVHNLREKMESKGVAFGRECRVFEVCNPVHAGKVLGENIEISTALPCRIAVYADALNLFNAGTVLSVNTRYPEVSIAGFDQPVVLGDATSVAQPRRWLLGARWSF